jgi:membrane associated rhomboid family serine protease
MTNDEEIRIMPVDQTSWFFPFARMNDSAKHPLELLLQLCGQAAPEPWYPSIYVKETGADREKLDPYLDQLRMGGLVRLTDWVQGRGQGYALTPAGQEVIQSPKLLSRLLAGKLAVRDGASSAAGRPSPEKGTAPTPWEKGETVRQALYSVTPLVTKVLLIANISVFLAGYFLPIQGRIALNDLVTGNSDVVHETGGITAIDLLHGQWWRLLSSFFVHFGLLHLGLNMYALYNLGQMAERIWGHLRFFVIYLIAGFGGSCVAMALKPEVIQQGAPVLVLVAGASGAICGIFAAEAGWFYLNRQHLPPQLFLAWQRNFIINLLILIYISFGFSGVSWEGHLGGALAGLAVGFFLNRFQFESGPRRWLAVGGVLLVPVLCFGFLLRAMNTNNKWQNLAQAERKRQLVSELRELREDHLPEVRRLEKTALHGISKIRVIKVRGHNPKEWTAVDVEEACETLKLARQKLSAAVLRLQEIGPYQDETAEEARQTRLKQIEAEIKYFQMQENHLRRGEEWTQEEQKMLEEQSDLALEMRKRWEELIK